MSILFLILLFTALLAGSAFFSGGETALFSLSRARLIAWKDERDNGRKLAAELMGEAYNRTLIVLILGNMFMNASLTLIDDEIMNSLGLDGVELMLASIIVSTVFLLALGEMIPKSIALMFPEKISESISGIIWGLRKILHPLIVVIERVLSLALDAIGRKESEPLSHEEYASYLDMAQLVGAFSGEETELISNALLMRERSVSSIMTSRVDVATIEKGASTETIQKTIRGSRELFYPIVEEDMDDCEAFLSAKDFFLLREDERRAWREKATIPGVFLPENASLTQSIRTMRERNAPAALVTDEYGGIVGMVRAKKIQEELVGDISSEFEEDAPLITATSPTSWQAAGSLSLEALSEATGIDFDDVASNTLNGFFSELTGRIPKQGDIVRFENLTITVLEEHNNRIIKARLDVGCKKNATSATP